nr:hypothetical protein [Tanacetum cinerariifolium]
MPIPGNLITTDIQGESYYQEYLAKVAKHQRYLAGETGSDHDSPAPKPTKTTKKSKPTTPKADPRPPVSKPVSSQQPEPKPAPAKTQGKKRKLVTEPSNKPSQARKSRPGLISKRRKPISSLRLVDESVAEGIPEKEPRVDDEDAGEGQAGPNPDDQDEGQAGPNPDDQDEGQAGPNPDEQSEGQAGPNPSDVEASQPLPSPVVHPGSDFEHMDLDVADVSTKPHPEQMDEWFTATAYPKVILEEPASSLWTLSSLQHLMKDLSFSDLVFNDKPSEADNEKTTTETKAESMVSVTIQQDMSSIPPMTTSVIDLTSRPESPNVHQLLKATVIETTTTKTKIHPPPSQPQQSTTDSMLMKHIGKLKHIMENLIQDNKHLEEGLDGHGARLYTLENLDIPQDLQEADMKEILHQRMRETNSYTTHEDHKMLYEALEKSMNRDHFEELLKDLAEARKKKKKRRDSPKMPPGSPPYQPLHPPPPAGLSRASGSLRASGSSQSFDDEDIRNAQIPKVNLWQDWWKPLEEERAATPEPAWSIPLSDVPVPKNNWAFTLASTYSPPPEDSLLAQTGDIAMFMNWFCKRQGITKLKPQDLEGLVFEIVKVFHPNVIHLQYQMKECHKLLTDSVDDSILRHNVSKPLPLGGPPGQVTIQSDFFFNKDLEYLRYGSKSSRPALLISKMKAAYYPNVGLEQMVPGQMWIEEECKDDIAAMYGISYWWFQRQ